MASNRDLIVQHIQQDFQALLAYVTGPQAQTQSAYTVELTLRNVSSTLRQLRSEFRDDPLGRTPAG